MKRLALYAHYDPQHEVKPYVRLAVESLRSHCEEIHFISTAQLPEAEQVKLAGICNSVLLNENRGMDFRMWQKALHALEPGDWEEIILLNSSVYGPVTPLEQIFQEAEGRSWDFWGITDSLEVDYHIQSYFLAFRSDLLRSEHFKAFWASVLPYRNKRQIIRSYEIGLTQYLLDSGYRCGVLFPYEDLLETSSQRVRWHGRKIRHPTNTIVSYAEPLIEQGAPFVKVELLRDNPMRMDLKPVRAAMKRLGYPEDCILAKKDASGLRRMNARSRDSCVICGSKGRILYTARPDARFTSSEVWDVIRCSDPLCRLMWMDPIPDASDMDVHGCDELPHPAQRSRVYQGVQGALLSLYRGMLHRMDLETRRADCLRHGLVSHPGNATPRLLDLDCRDGWRLRLFRDQGWDAEGCVADPVVAERLRREGLTMHDSGWEALSHGRYQAIFVGDRLGQVEDPKHLLKACHLLLSAGGSVCLEVPNASGFGHHCFRRHWQGMDVPRHYHAFTPSNLRALLCQVGFEAVRVETTPVLAQHLAQDSLDLLRRGHSRPCHAPSREESGLTALAYQILALQLHRIFPGTGDTCSATALKS